jgi:hypothetical protein
MLVFIIAWSCWYREQQAMRLPRLEYECKIGGWQVGITVCPGLWAIGVYWQDDPLGVYLSLPLLMLSLERNREPEDNGWDLDWFLLRFIIGKQELRLELDLHGWLVGIKMFQTNDWSIHLGPLDLECEWNKLFRNDEWPMKPTLRLLSKAGPGCDCMDVETEDE